MLREVLDLLNPRPGSIILDGTLGGGGHTEALCAAGSNVVAIDKDVHALNNTESRLRLLFPESNCPIRFVHADYRFFTEALDLLNIDKIDGFLLDLGLSSDQLADSTRGFSYDSEGELDMRFDSAEGEPVYDLLLRLSESDIADIIYKFGEERFSRRIAKKIVERRGSGVPIQSARELADVVRRCVPMSRKHPIDPATRTFQALRIAVNDELGSLQTALNQLPNRIQPGGIAVVISFHSLEDRIVKNAFRKTEGEKRIWQPLTPKPITASAEEFSQNPRARSAKLRAAVRIG